MRQRGFTGELWAAAEPTYAAILRHPFVTGLSDGTLDVEAFQFYVIEDAYYLVEFARAVSLVAAKAPKDNWIVILNKSSISLLEAERLLHESYFHDFALSENELAQRPVAPTTLAYTNYLLTTAHSRPFAEALSCILPCYWIYLEVGKTLSKTGSPDPLYQRWIDNYGAEEYEAEVNSLLHMVDEVAEGETDVCRRAMKKHFFRTSCYEWMFWDMAYRKEAWPV